MLRPYCGRSNCEWRVFSVRRMSPVLNANLEGTRRANALLRHQFIGNRDLHFWRALGLQGP